MVCDSLLLLRTPQSAQARSAAQASTSGRAHPAILPCSSRDAQHLGCSALPGPALSGVAHSCHLPRRSTARQRLQPLRVQPTELGNLVSCSIQCWVCVSGAGCGPIVLWAVHLLSSLVQVSSEEEYKRTLKDNDGIASQSWCLTSHHL